MLGIIDRMVCRLEWVAERIVMCSFGIMVLAVLVSVFTRNISIPVTWLEELSRYMQIWFVSIGFALALRKGLLAGSEVVLKLLPEKVSKWVIVLCKLVMLAISILLLTSGFQLIMHLFNTGQESPNMRIPIVYVYLGIYSGFILAVVFLISSLLFNLQGKKDQLDKTFLTIGELEEPPGPAGGR